MSQLKYLTAGVVVALCGLLSACAGNINADLDHASSAIRAARVAGAETYARSEIEAADVNYQKAQMQIEHFRTNRARKLLQLATAQADLATAISEAEHAEGALANLESN